MHQLVGPKCKEWRRNAWKSGPIHFHTKGAGIYQNIFGGGFETSAKCIISVVHLVTVSKPSLNMLKHFYFLFLFTHYNFLYFSSTKKLHSYSISYLFLFSSFLSILHLCHTDPKQNI